MRRILMLRGEVRESLMVFGLKLLSLGIGIATTVVLARLLGPANFGLYSLIIAVASLASLPAHAGFETLVVRTTAAGYAHAQWGLIRGLWRWVARMQILLCLLIMVLACGILWLSSGHLSVVEVNAALIGIAIVPLLSFNSTRMAMMRGMGDPVGGVILEALLRPILLLAGLAVLWQLSRIGVVSALLTYLIAGALAVVLGYFLVHRRKRVEISRAPHEFLASQWRRSVFPLALLIGIERLITYTDMVLLGALATTTDVGLYRVAVQGSDLIVFVLSGLMLVFGPRLARLYTRGDLNPLQRLVTLGSRWSAVAAGCAFLGLMVAGKPLIEWVFGTRYSESFQPLIILASGQLVVAWFGVTLTLLKMTGKERSTIIILGIAAVGNIVLNLILIPPFGPTGAALATALTLALSRIALSRAVRMQLGVQTGALGRASEAKS